MALPQPEQQTPPPPPQLTPEQIAELREQERKQKTLVASIIAGVVLILVLLGVAIYFLMQPTAPTDKIRDVFIIVVALESLIIGVALIVLIVQLASLINLLQNEVRPILNATNETVNTLRGTAEFLGENMVEPVIKLNGYLAGLKRMLELLGVKPK
jgi:amino acid permease